MRILFLSLILLLSATVSSQNFTGKVLDEKKNPIIGSTVYIRENKQGLVCNETGAFQINLPAGNYHCEIRCLGYEPDSLFIRITGAEKVYKEITLRSKYFNLAEIVVDNKEDPAYAIMRKAIEKAPFHLARVKAYTSEAYLKGSGKITDIPKFATVAVSKDNKSEIEMIKDQLFLQESFSEIKFTNPDKYEQNVLAFSSTVPDNLDPKDVIMVVTGSLYNPEFGGFVSPLNPKAFNYYKFRYEGFDEIDGDNINKIKIIPKLKDPQLMSGYLYIADNTWDIRHAELMTTNIVGSLTYNISYNDIQSGIFMPIAYTTHFEISAFGVKGFLDYLSSIKYTSIEIDETLVDSRKITKQKKAKESLEIKPDDKYKIESDSLALKRDSLYWSDIRVIPLNTEELKSYEKKDSIQMYVDSLRENRNNRKFKPSDIIFGGRIGGDSTKVYFKFGGLISAVPNYSFVDGFWLGQKVELGIKRNENSLLKITPSAYWTTARKALIWDVDMSLTYAPLRLGKVSVSAGSRTEDYNNMNGKSPIGNALYSLFFGMNSSRFYENNFLNISNQIDIANGLNLTLGLTIAERNPLQNHTTFSFWGKPEDAKPNIPTYNESLNEQFTGLNRYSIGLKYTPESYYSIDKGKKRYLKSRFPTFSLAYTQGVSGIMDNSSNFSRLEGSVSQFISLGFFDRLMYDVRGGGFLNTNSFNYIDYKHFNSAYDLLTTKSFISTYALLDFYNYSTSKHWAQAFVTYNTNYLLLKRLSFLQGKFFSESLHARFLYTPDKPYHNEWGYSVGIPMVGEVGVFTSFDSFKHVAWGFTVSLGIFQLFGGN
ncbi:MAG: DUF5686 and carboxypeptidase regulatory-like domain-containing protein [Dysgonamonadaceae bacterium]|jgi:hypothetical protein|nr:DUF5686 and carboxypeptidase regulatory-like domain-containing protein [Dysgonamonadaceae bacterium]